MIFHVVHRETGDLVSAEGFWAVDEDGMLVDVIDGWGCEGGGGYANAPVFAIAVIGPAPVVDLKVLPVLKLSKPFKCDSCDKNFTTSEGMAEHIKAKHE